MPVHQATRKTTAPLGRTNRHRILNRHPVSFWAFVGVRAAFTANPARGAYLSLTPLVAQGGEAAGAVLPAVTNLFIEVETRHYPVLLLHSLRAGKATSPPNSPQSSSAFPERPGGNSHIIAEISGNLISWLPIFCPSAGNHVFQSSCRQKLSRASATTWQPGRTPGPSLGIEFIYRNWLDAPFPRNKKPLVRGNAGRSCGNPHPHDEDEYSQSENPPKPIRAVHL